MIAALMTWFGGAIVTAISANCLISSGRFGLFLVATAGAVGCNIGSAIAFEVGARGGRPPHTVGR